MKIIRLNYVFTPALHWGRLARRLTGYNGSHWSFWKTCPIPPLIGWLHSPAWLKLLTLSVAWVLVVYKLKFCGQTYRSLWPLFQSSTVPLGVTLIRQADCHQASLPLLHHPASKLYQHRDATAAAPLAVCLKQNTRKTHAQPILNVMKCILRINIKLLPTNSTYLI